MAPLGGAPKPIPAGAVTWCVDEACRAVLDDVTLDGDGAARCPDCGVVQVVLPHLREQIARRRQLQLGLGGVA